MARLTRRVERLESQQAAAAGCRHLFHYQWHILYEDEETGQIPPRPTCPSCGAEADQVVVVEYEFADLWRNL